MLLVAKLFSTLVPSTLFAGIYRDDDSLPTELFAQGEGELLSPRSVPTPPKLKRDQETIDGGYRSPLVLYFRDYFLFRFLGAS